MKEETQEQRADRYEREVHSYWANEYRLLACKEREAMKTMLEVIRERKDDADWREANLTTKQFTQAEKDRAWLLRLADYADHAADCHYNNSMGRTPFTCTCGLTALFSEPPR